MRTEQKWHSTASLTADLSALGVESGDGVFLHASLRSIGSVVGGARAVVSALLDTVDPHGLIGMPGFSSDAYFPVGVERQSMNEPRAGVIEKAILGFDPARSPMVGMGAIAETWISQQNAQGGTAGK